MSRLQKHFISMHGLNRTMLGQKSIVGDNGRKAGWSWGCVAAIDSKGRTIWIVDADRGDGLALASPSIWSHGLDRSNLSSERIKLCCEALGSFTEKSSAPLTATSAM